MKNSAKLG